MGPEVSSGIGTYRWGRGCFVSVIDSRRFGTIFNLIIFNTKASDGEGIRIYITGQKFRHTYRYGK